MTQFATVAELGDILGEQIDLQDARANLALELASAAIQNYTNQTISLVENDAVDLPGSWTSVLELPERPVVAVNSISVNGSELAADLYTVGTGGRVYYGSSVFGEIPNTLGWWGGALALVEVDYDHGYAVIPDDIKLVCLRSASRLYQRPDTPGEAVSESMGQYSYTLAANEAAQGFLTDERRILNRYRSRPYSVLVS